MNEGQIYVAFSCQAFLHVEAPSANHKQVIATQTQSINLDLFTHMLLLIKGR